MKNMAKNMKQKGFTLIELLIVLSIAAVVLVGIFMVVPKLTSQSKANTEVTNISTIIAGVKGMYTSYPNYASVTIPSLIQAGVFPNSMVGSTTTVNNGWGGAVNVSPTSLGAGVNNAFDISYANVPPEDCSKMVNAMSANIEMINIGGTTVKLQSQNVADPAAVANACSAGGTPKVIVFTKL